ncbi:AIPR family protein [Mucilaginibacter sabulilitoris]|uniref:AIPR family protein n=1 Tax=Mucilaginibacter sabulilitoris TaxID=1173583 RepID=A0ABZ0TH11_9SPHI|nr:AIPR family protein [Mucilaginibacter sabulilitoris]WPU92490.1 AIPR family protein [Mucilaginibacter sabulilitoris]
MASIEEFHEDFLQSILSDAESRALLKAQSFFEIVCEDLVSVGDLTNNYSPAEYIKKGIEAYGYDYDDERKILTILNHQFFQDNIIQTLTKGQIETKFNRLKTFYKKSTEGLYKEMEETSEAYSMAYNIYKYVEKKQLHKVRFMVLTDGKATRNLMELPSETDKDIQFEFRVVDIEYLHNIYQSESKAAVSDIEVNLPCLKINDENNSYQSYLTVINGDLLVSIYEDHGQKLFEQNVRTFLQFKGNVNKGLKNTIEYKPEMFFAYNNGITATAESVEVGSDGHLKKIKNFQIVNGGQTTSAIYAARMTSNLDVSQVAVQMKLSVVKKTENQDDFISKVAEYANTQNKINNSDFFSNSPFHKDMKDYSNRIYAPAIGGSQKRTHWFYERVRGEYLNSQAYLKPAEKGRFINENPKQQVVDKTLLSKTEVMWRRRPDIVSKGAQESFKKFADEITETLEKDNLAITETYFKDAICRVILFRAVEKIISAAPWYDGGFRAQTVAYTVSYLSALTLESGLHLNFDLIWETQEIPQSLIEMLKLISEQVYQKITRPAAGYANITQWTKNSMCWTSVQEIDLDFPDLDPRLFIDRAEKNYQIKESKGIKVVDKGIDAQVFVLKVTYEDWNKLYDYYRNYKGIKNLSSMQLGVLEKMASGKIDLPSEKQSKILYQVYSSAKSEGVNVN